MTNIRSILLALSLLVTNIGSVSALENSSNGISFYTLRVIYPESSKQGVSLTAYNKSPDTYLMQSWIRPVDFITGDVDTAWQGSPMMPFIITPPLSRFEANSELTLRIRRNDVSLPADRESVFFISMKALPSQKPNADQIVMTVVTNMKLFYRPNGLSKRAVAEQAKKLTFSSNENQLVVTNPTPYWMTFSHLAIGGTQLSKSGLRRMVPPFGKQTYDFSVPVVGKITWQVIDEDGWNTPTAQQSI